MEKIAWVVRPFPHGINRLDYFLDNNVIAIGWPGIGELKDMNTREDVKKKLLQGGYYKEKSPQILGQAAGTIYRFVKEMKNGDYVLVPNGANVIVGKIMEDQPFYVQEFDSNEEGFCHQRRVEWLFEKKSIPRNLMTSRVYDSLKGQSTLFTTHFQDIADLVKNKKFLFVGDEKKNERIQEEYLKKLNSGKIIGLNSNKIEDIACEILKRYLPGIGRLSTQNTKGSGDSDLKAELLGGIVVRVQIKNFYKDFGDVKGWVVDQLADSMEEMEYGIVLTTTAISEEAKERANYYLINERKKISFIDGVQLVELIFENIDNFSDENLLTLGLQRQLNVL